MKSNRIISAILVFTFTVASIPCFENRDCPPRGLSLFSQLIAQLAPQSRLTQAEQIEALTGPDEALYNKICGDINRIANQVISLEKDPDELTKAIIDAISGMTPDQFGKIAPHMVNFLAKKYEKYEVSSYGFTIRARMGIIRGLGKIGEKAAEAQLKPIASSIIEILSGELNSDDEADLFWEVSAEALGEIGETLMLSELGGREDIAKRITVILRDYITGKRSWNSVATEAAIRALGKIGIKEEETVSILREFAEDSGSVLQEPALAALQQLGVVESGTTSRPSEIADVETDLEEPNEDEIISGLINEFKQSPTQEGKGRIIRSLHKIGSHAVRALQAATRKDPAAQVMIANVILDLNYPRDSSASRRGGFFSYKLPLLVVGSAVIAFALPAILPYISAISGVALALAPILGNGLGKPRVEVSESDIHGLIRALKDPKPEARIEAAFKLGRIGIAASPELRELIVSVLVRALEDNDSRVRTNAAGAIGIIGFPEAVEAASALRKVLDKDPNCDVQQAARFSFQTIELRMTSHPTISMLLASIIDEREELHNRQRDARLLFEVGENENVITNAALYALDLVGEPSVRGLLARGLIRLGPGILRGKIETFKAAKYKEGLGRISNCLRDAAEFNKDIPDVAQKIGPLSELAEAALRELASPAAVEDKVYQLIRDLRVGLTLKYNAQNAKAIRDGIDSLMPACKESPSIDLKVEAVLLFLEAIESYKDKLVRQHAIYAIGEIAGGKIGKEVISRVPRIIPTLTGVLLTDEDSGVKTKAAEALGKIELGREKARARDALTTALQGTYHNPKLRLAIRQALRGMEAAKPRSGAFEGGIIAASSP